VIQVLPEAVTIHCAGACPPGEVAPEVRIREQGLQAEPELAVQLAWVEHDAGPAQRLAPGLAGHRLQQRE
jgi:hypothetical protein